MIMVDTYRQIILSSSNLGKHEVTQVKASDSSIQKVPNTTVKRSFDNISAQKLFVPTALTIDAIGIKNAPIATVGVSLDGAMQVPTNPNVVGWYKNSPIGGQDGNIVLSGHYDWYGGVKGVFYTLNNVKVGDLVTLSGINAKQQYTVYDVKYVPNNEISAVKEAFRKTLNQQLTLITCGGVWDNVAQSYDKRFLVKAILNN